MRQILFWLAIIVGVTGWAQDRFDSGELKGFTRSPTEHIINRVDERILTSNFKGEILMEDGSPVKNVLVEIRDPQGLVRGALTDAEGRFHFRTVPPAVYVFKVTLNGFQSVVGDVEISKHARKPKPITIKLRFGV